MTTQYRRRVGTVRPSHLMYTSGVGALVDLPNFSVLIRGLDDWNYDRIPEAEPIVEPRLLAAVKTLLNTKTVAELRPAPWRDGIDNEPTGPASTIGVPTAPFPAWLRCTVCNELAPIDSQIFGFENDRPRRPDDARFFHPGCPKKRSNPPPLAVAARFVLACTSGHLDDFPYDHFVHRGTGCPEASHPRMQMQDFGGNLGANVQIRCVNCGQARNMRDALGVRGEQNLPRCRGRHPHLATFDPDGCATESPPKVLVVGASNQWFAQTLSALAVPRTGASELATKVERYWDTFASMPGGREMLPYLRTVVPALREFERWTDDEIWAVVEAHRASAQSGEEEGGDGYPDLRAPEWEIFSLTTCLTPTTTSHCAAIPGDCRPA